MPEFSEVASVANILAVVGLLYTVHATKQATRVAHYTEIDRMYMDILTMRIDNEALLTLSDQTAPTPALNSPAYSTHAYIVWNFIETICDRCNNDPELRQTWLPVVIYEARLHRAWFVANCESRFKAPFRDGVREAFRRLDQQPNCPEAAFEGLLAGNYPPHGSPCTGSPFA